MRVTILGAGAGGLSAAVDLTRAGHRITLWTQSADTLAPWEAARGIAHRGVLGEGFTRIEAMTTDLARAAHEAQVLLVCVPTLAHAALARALIRSGRIDVPTILNPGHTGGSLEFHHVFRTLGRHPPPVAEFSTLTYVARIPQSGPVAISGRAKTVRVAALPGGERALSLALELYGNARPVTNVLATGLSNVNLVLHPPGSILGAAWIEATQGGFTFYVQGLTDGVARVMESLDQERRTVARSYGIELDSLFEEMRAIGTIEADADPAAGLAAIRSGLANRSICAPGGFAHRYYQEDFWYGLTPFLALADIARVETPCARSLMLLADIAAGPARPAERRTAEAMGIAGIDKPALLERVNGPQAHGSSSRFH